MISIQLFWFSEILPLVEFTPEDDIPEQEVERLLLAPPKSNMEQIDPFVDTMINEDVSDILPLTLDRDALRALEPTTILIAKWPPPLKVRYYRNLMPEWQISMCPECLQVSFASTKILRINTKTKSLGIFATRPFDFHRVMPKIVFRSFQVFHSEDFELQVLQKGHCPFCRTNSDTLLN